MSAGRGSRFLSGLRGQRYTLVKFLNLVVVVALLTCFTLWASRVNAADAAVAEQIREAERAASRGPFANDGSFEGSAQGFGGIVKMRAVVENGYVSAVEIVDASHEDAAWLDMCQGIPGQIVDAQSTDIDTVSGATFTSAGMINATTQALEQAQG